MSTNTLKTLGFYKVKAQAKNTHIADKLSLLFANEILLAADTITTNVDTLEFIVIYR